MLRRSRDVLREKDEGVNRIRGVVMLLAGAVAGWKGWQIHRGEQALLAYGLAVLALAIGVWHLTRKAPEARRRSG